MVFTTSINKSDKKEISNKLKFQVEVLLHGLDNTD